MKPILRSIKSSLKANFCDYKLIIIVRKNNRYIRELIHTHNFKLHLCLSYANDSHST